MMPNYAEQPTAELVKLAQRELHGDSALSDDASFAKLEMRRAQPARLWVKRWVAGGAALACVGVLAATLWLPSHGNTLTFEVAGGGLGAKGHVVGAEATRIRFSDGSEAKLAKGAEATIQKVTEHGAEVVLERGSMHFQVAKKPQAAWTVAAGPYDVHVTGTAFDVSWSKQTQAFDLRMATGSVIVTGPLAQGGIVLKAGQRMFGGVAEGRLTVEGGAEPAVAAPRAVASLEPTPEANSPAPEAIASSPAARPAPEAASAPEAHRWRRQVAQGQFEAVLQDAEQRGLSRILDAGSLEELAALADAARYAGRAAIAKRVLLAERQRFAKSPAARDAAFFLGRLAEDSGGAAIEWYERYVAESPRGAYASQAFGRKMMLLYKQRGAEAARPVALEYLSRYPNGPYAAAARKLEQESTSAPLP